MAPLIEVRNTFLHLRESDEESDGEMTMTRVRSWKRAHTTGSAVDARNTAAASGATSTTEDERQAESSECATEVGREAARGDYPRRDSGVRLGGGVEGRGGGGVDRLGPKSSGPNSAEAIGRSPRGPKVCVSDGAGTEEVTAHTQDSAQSWPQAALRNLRAELPFVLVARTRKSLAPRLRVPREVGL